MIDTRTTLDALQAIYQQAHADYCKGGYHVPDAQPVADALHALAVWYAERGEMYQARAHQELAERYMF